MSEGAAKILLLHAHAPLVSFLRLRRSINVPAGGNLQSAIDSARLGDTIVLAAGATYTGNYTLPAKTGSGWIIIRSSAADST